MTDITWKQRKIEGYAMMTCKQYEALDYLNRKDDVGYIWDSLDDVHGNTIRCLIERDWIVQSVHKKTSHTAYRITSRGVKALKIYSTPTETYRTDGICPECEERPRNPELKYCRKCYNAIKLRAYHRKEKKNYRKPGGICPKCKKRPRHTTRGGTTHSVCIVCNREYQREYMRRKRAENPNYGQGRQ